MRLIDADKLDWWYKGRPIRRVIDEAPTVDAVPVVRCKDCKHWIYIGDGMGDCTNGRFHLDNCPDPTMMPEEFCCLGERKDNDNQQKT